MSGNGLTVECHSWEPKKKGRPHTVSRVLCIEKAYPYCKRCPNSRFVLRLRFQFGEQIVACPRWTNGSRANGAMPVEYVPVRREICLKKSTFEFCPSCPNSRADMPKMSDPGWYERMHR